MTPGRACRSIRAQSPAWVKRAFLYLSGDDGFLNKETLEHVLSCARLDAAEMLDYCMRFIAGSETASTEGVAEAMFVEAFERCLAFFRGEMVSMKEHVEDEGPDDYYIFSAKLAAELEALYELSDEERGQALLKMPKLMRGRVLRRIDPTSLGKAIYTLDARETR